MNETFVLFLCFFRSSMRPRRGFSYALFSITFLPQHFSHRLTQHNLPSKMLHPSPAFSSPMLSSNQNPTNTLFPHKSTHSPNQRVVRFSQFEEQQSWEESSTKSFLTNTTKMAAVRIEIKETDMKQNMVNQAMDIVRDGLQKCTQDKDIASFVKDNMEKQFGPTWHCVVGKSFGSRVSYELESFALFKVNQHTVLIFKCG